MLSCLTLPKLVFLDRARHPPSPRAFKADLLTTIGKLEVQWTELLPLHLHFDIESLTLYVFRFPSYCLASIPELGGTKTLEEPVRSILQR